MNSGYVLLWRKTVESGLMHNPEIFTFFCWALLKATHKAHNHLVGNQMVKLQPGQFVMGRDAAAKELKTTPRKIRTALSTLIKLGILTSKATNKFTIITVAKWATYQNIKTANDQHNDQQSTSSRPAVDHKQELKEQYNGTFPDEFWSTWREWEDYRVEKKKTLTLTTMKRQLNTLAKLPTAHAVLTLERSMENGWVGLFPEKAQAKPKRDSGKYGYCG